MRISYKDNYNKLENYIQTNKNIKYICGNPFIISIIISIITIIIINLNSGNYIPQFVYTMLFVLPLILLENFIIKINYKIKDDNKNNNFSNINSNSDIIPPREFKIGKNETDTDIFANLINLD